MDVQEQILNAAQAIRKKYSALKRGYDDEREEVEKKLEPIVKPLKTLVELTNSASPQNPMRPLNFKKLKSEKLKKPRFAHETINNSHDISNQSAEIDRSENFIQDITSANQDEGSSENFEDTRESNLTLAGDEDAFNVDDIEMIDDQHQSNNPLVDDTDASAADIADVDDDDDDDDDIHNQTPHDFFNQKFKISPKLNDTLTSAVTTNMGPLGSKYFIGLITDNLNEYDTKFGVYYDAKNNIGWKMGDKIFRMNKRDEINITGARLPFTSTEGLLELIFKKDPNTSKVSDEDVVTYGEILDLTNAARREYSPHGRVKSNNSIKYKTIIGPLFYGKKVAIGRGFVTYGPKSTQYAYWNDPNELVDRLVLLIASRKSGNTSHDLEIASIEEELRESGIIS